MRKENDMAIGNSVDDEVREQRQKVFQNEGFKGKLNYIAYYYKWHAIAIVFVLAMICAMIYSQVTKKDIALQVIYINGFPNVESTDFMADFQKTTGINEAKEETLLDDSLYINLDSPGNYDEQNVETLYAKCSAGLVDVCVVDESYFMKMAEGGFFLDLSSVLSEEQMEQYKDRIVWYDRPEDYKEGEEAVAIEVTNAPKIVSTQSYPNSKCYYGIITTAENIDNSVAFLKYLETP